MACDFCVVVTATFRLFYVFVVVEIATRRILHVNVTAHPTALWGLQQLRDEFLVYRQSHPTWTGEQRREVVARTLGSLRDSRTSSEAFAQRKQDEKAREERRWKT